MEKLKVGWFSFSCCEDNSIIFTEMLNDHFEEWSKIMEFQHIRILRSKNKLEGLDIAFVEGAISTDKDAKKLKKIRENCKTLIAIGSCAVNAMPSAQRNLFDPKRKEEIEFLVERFHLSKKVQKLSDVVKVDDQVPGCPISEKDFLKVLDKYTK